MIEDHGLNLAAIHVFTTRDDHVLLAVCRNSPRRLDNGSLFLDRS
jgi:hypothetical protein